MNTQAIHTRRYLWYKCLNSLFTGVSVGAIFTLYAPLEPSLFSLGGILLALAMLLIAKMYQKIMNWKSFYAIAMAVELVMLSVVLAVLLLFKGYYLALYVYVGYQLTFAFGSYLVRAETVLFKKRALLSFFDVAKQKGYLLGMALSYLFYKISAALFIDIDAQRQLYDLHFLLLLIQLTVILTLYSAFRGFFREL